MHVAIKRAYDSPDKSDGTRVLVDRIWPRGVSRDEAAIDYWLKDLAPSDNLRKWFAHDPQRWETFRERYFAELDTEHIPVAQLCKLTHKGHVTLVFGAKDEEHNNAVALKEYLENYCPT